MGTVYDRYFAAHGERVALIAGAERITYAELRSRVLRLSLHLLDLGVRPLDRVLVQLPNVPEFVYLYFALERTGAIPIMALPSHRFTELDAFAALAEASAYAFPERQGDFEFAPLARRLREKHGSLRLLLSDHRISELLDAPPSAAEVDLDALDLDPDEPCILQLSGGTTGVPKLIPRTHNDYVYNTKLAVAHNDVRADDCLLVVLPIAHNFPLACPGISGFFQAGARAVLSPSTRAADAFELIERERVTHLELVPALLIRWLDDPALAGRDLSSVRIINTGGQRLQPEVKRRAEQLIPGCTVQEIFGMAEGLLSFVRLDDPPEVRLETVGRPASPDDEIRLVDEEDREVPDGEIGELLVRGPYTLRGYYAVPEYNQRAFTTDGFYRSGDLMWRHPSGSLVVAGRKKDLINRGGEKISCEEIENLILGHPAVLNVACVPMPDRVLGERMCAFVILRPGQRLDLTELTAYLGELGVARFKLPERLESVDEFPVSKFGKVAKNVLSAQIAEKLAGAAPAGGPAKA